MQINPQIFREYDIRGTVDKDLSEDFAYGLGKAYATLAKDSGKNQICIGWDCRVSSPIYAQALARGMSDEGIDAILTGMGPTPQLYFAIYELSAGGGIQVTGSHNPPDMNGFKICLGKNTLSGTEIKDLYQRMIKLPEVAEATKKGSIKENFVAEKYLATLIENSKPHMGKRKLKVVVDAGNGVGGMLGPQLLRALGVEVIELFCEPDGNFPNHHPDPSEPETLETLIHEVKSNNADFGIGWDGDADRIGIVDEKGNILFGDMVLLLYARDVLTKVPNATIIGDVKCSERLFADLKKRGAKPIMWKTGHSLIKGKLRETGAELAGEMSGHMFFNDRYFGFDDAVYGAARFAEIVSKSEQQVSEMLADLPPSYSTPEIRIDCPEEIKFKVPEELKKSFAHLKVDTTDGARVTFEKGWGLVRASNTQPILVLRFEAESPASLNEYKDTFMTEVNKVTAMLMKSL
jgi:phosphomannomutase / phosphoglucomutase